VRVLSEVKPPRLVGSDGSLCAGVVRKDFGSAQRAEPIRLIKASWAS
jgi:hypothetical protein